MGENNNLFRPGDLEHVNQNHHGWQFRNEFGHNLLSQEFNGEENQYRSPSPSPSPNIPLAQNTNAASAVRRIYQNNANALNMTEPPRTPPTRNKREAYAQILRNWVSPKRNTRVAGLTPPRGAGSMSLPTGLNIDTSGHGSIHNLSENELREIRKMLNQANANRKKLKAGTKRTHSNSHNNFNLNTNSTPSPKRPTYAFGRPQFGKKGGTRRLRQTRKH